MDREKRLVLIADDDPDIRTLIREILGTEEYEFTEVSDGKNVLPTAKEEKPDLIVLDVMMPGKQGFYVFNDLRKNTETCSIPVIIATALESKTGIHYSAEKLRDLVGEEPESFLEKPFEPKTLLDAVAKALQK